VKSFRGGYTKRLRIKTLRDGEERKEILGKSFEILALNDLRGRERAMGLERKGREEGGAEPFLGARMQSASNAQKSGPSAGTR